MNINQALVIIALISALVLWTRGKPNKALVGAGLLLVFSIFGGTPLEKVFFFPLSPSFFVIVLSFVFSQGIVNSGLTEKLIEPLIVRFSGSIYSFFAFMVVNILVLSFAIPQPFSRAVLLAMVYRRYFAEIKLDKKIEESLLFSLFALNAVTNTLLRDFDIILNRAFLSISGFDLGSLQWIKLFFLPGLVMLLVVYLALSFIYKKSFDLAPSFRVAPRKLSLDGDDYFHLGLVLVTVLLWQSQDLHGIDGGYFILLAIIAMYLRGSLELKDLKSINIELLVFLTAAFSIGNVMMGSGIAQGIFSRLALNIDGGFSTGLVLVVVFTSMGLHMILGSVTTTMSVVIPSFFAMTAGRVDPLLLGSLAFISMAMHYVLPIHHALISVGLGNDFYSNKPVLGFALVSTLATLAGLFLVYIPWWKFIGLI